jgi:CheY-like chemotaxis protein
LSTRRILIVDDDEDLRAIVELSFESGGDWEVDTASDGTAALERAAAARPDVILLDWNMPGLDGPATLQRLRAAPATAQVPVVMLTANVDAPRESRLHGLDVKGVLSKPVDPWRLPGDVRDLLGWT